MQKRLEYLRAPDAANHSTRSATSMFTIENLATCFWKAKKDHFIAISVDEKCEPNLGFRISAC